MTASPQQLGKDLAQAQADTKYARRVYQVRALRERLLVEKLNVGYWKGKYDNRYNDIIRKTEEKSNLELELRRAREDADAANVALDEANARPRDADPRHQRALAMVRDLQADMILHSSFEKVPVRVIQEAVRNIAAALTCES